ncbi:MAG: nickel pincer cofactor biosynthesis protein LarC [Phycisphaerae bacterium]|nr:nickel pincer cofactor biosynthesis protein LarC [Phycisphaerae bacterium]
MRVAYFDCFNGASGDMILGAMIDAGLSFATLRDALAGLGVGGYTLHAEKVSKQGFSATQFTVDLDPQAHQPHRHLSHIRKIIEPADLAPSVKDRALAVFQRLAEAEARAHGTTVEKVHFHEVGAIDAIVDVVGAAIGLDALGVERVVSSAIPVGSGVIHCDHGEMPVPAPATAILLENVPIAASPEQFELTTPTGAAILTTLAEQFGPVPSMTLESVGFGAGHRDGRTRPNVLRVMLGREVDASTESDQVAVLEANIDDATAETIGHACERLLSAGALDAYCTPIVMKKNRPAVKVTVLCKPETVEDLEEVLFAETPTFGVRVLRAERRKLEREHVTVQTRFGPIRIKVGRRGGKTVTASPEYDDCRAAALDHNAPLRTVMDEARRVWEGQG